MDEKKKNLKAVDDVTYLKIVMSDGEENGEKITFSVANAKIQAISEEAIEDFSDLVIEGDLFQTASGNDINALYEAYLIKTERQNLS